MTIETQLMHWQWALALECRCHIGNVALVTQAALACAASVWSQGAGCTCGQLRAAAHPGPAGQAPAPAQPVGGVLQALGHAGKAAQPPGPTCYLSAAAALPLTEHDQALIAPARKFSTRAPVLPSCLSAASACQLQPCLSAAALPAGAS